MKESLTQLHLGAGPSGGREDTVQTQCWKDKLAALFGERTHFMLRIHSERLRTVTRRVARFGFSSCVVFHRVMVDRLNRIMIHSSSSSANEMLKCRANALVFIQRPRKRVLESLPLWKKGCLCVWIDAEPGVPNRTKIFLKSYFFLPFLLPLHAWILVERLMVVCK